MNITRPEQLGSLIKEQRKKTGLTQKDVSELVGLRCATISDFENRCDTSKLETLFKILAALNLQLEVTSRGDHQQNDSQWDESW